KISLNWPRRHWAHSPAHRHVTMRTGIIYAIIAGLFWGTSPVLVKRGLAHSNVSAATLCQQATILLTLLCAALLEGDLFAGKIPPLAILIFSVTGVVGAYLGRTLFIKSVDQIGASLAQSYRTIWV